MSASLLVPNVPSAEETPVKRWLRLPLAVLAMLVLAFFLEIRWLQSSASGNAMLFHQTPTGWQKLPAPKGYPESLRVSSRGTVWVLTWGSAGLSRWDGAAWQYFKESDFGTRTSFLDREFALDGEQVWLPVEQGMMHWDGRTWHTDRSVTAGFGASVVAGGGEVRVIDSTGKLSHFAQGRWNSQTLVLPGVKWSQDEDAENPKLARTTDGSVWLMRQGLWRWDGAAWKAVSLGGDIWKDAELIGAAGDRVWLSSAAGLLAVAPDGEQSTVYLRQKIGLGDEVWITESAAAGGRTWFGTSQGVVEFDGTHWRKLPLPPGGVTDIQRVAAGPDGALWIVGSPHRGPGRAFRYLLYLQIATPLAILCVVGWIATRFRKRQLQQHQRVAQAVQHATGEVPEELESGAGRLRSRGLVGTAFLWIGTPLVFVLLRMVWPQAPYWMIAVIGISIHLLLTFQESLVRRRPKPSDPIGPGGPSRYNWGKSWKAVAGTVALLLLANLDRLPMLRFLRGYWLWIFVVVPVFYHTVAVHLLNRAARRGDYDGALKIIRWTYFYNPFGMEPLRMSGHMLLLAGRYREAEDTLRRSLVSSHARESYGLALEYLGDALLEQGRFDEATRSYEAALHAFAWRRRPYRGLAEMLLRRGQKPQLALEYVEKILDYSGISWSEQKRNGNSKDDYWALKAWALARLGRTSEVAEAIENALKYTNLKSAPDLASTHYRAGMAMLALGNEPAAKRHFRLAADSDPHGRRGSLAQAELRESMGTVRI